MKEGTSALKDIGLGLGVALVLSGAILAAQQVGTTTAKGARQPDYADPCCSITAIDVKAGVITAKVTATGQTFTLKEIPAGAIGSFKVGETLDLACAVPPSAGGTTGATGSAATSGTPPTTTAPKLPWVTSTSCGTPGTTGTGTTGGTNVPRDSGTRSTQPQPRKGPVPECVATTAAGARATIPCPDGVQVRAVK